MHLAMESSHTVRVLFINVLLIKGTFSFQFCKTVDINVFVISSYKYSRCTSMTSMKAQAFNKIVEGQGYGLELPFAQPEI